MKRIHKLLAIAAVLLAIMALVPAASAGSGAPLRADGTATFVGWGWAYEFDGDFACTGFAEVPEMWMVGEPPIGPPFGHGTMHWFEVMELDCDGGTMTLENYGTWTFDNGKFRVNGTVIDATGDYLHLVGASAHQQGLVPAVFPLTGTVSLRIN